MSEANLNLLDEATRLHAAGLCVLPAFAKTKVPAVESWKRYQRVRPAESELEKLMRRASALCVICGEVSGHVELLDFDVESEQFEAWANLIRDRSPGLLERLYLERSQSGGMHAVYRCVEPVEGAVKLSGRIVACESNAEVVIAGKRYKPRKSKGGGFEVQLTLIETKGESGLFLCAPSPGYELVQGDLANLPVLSSEEHAVLIEAAIELDQRPRVASDAAGSSGGSSKAARVEGATFAHRPGTRPGDAFNAEGDIRSVLIKHGWKLSRPSENEYWTRPGKSAGTSATFNGQVFFVFSTNAAPFEPDRGYSKFAVFALLEHEGDFAQAARALRADGWGGGSMERGHAWTDSFHTEVDVIEQDEVEAQPVSVPDRVPQPFPQHLLEVPGFISAVMEYNHKTAHRWQPILALSGAIVLQAVLAARKVRDERGNRTNLYVVNLAGSGAGKEHARTVNKNVLEQGRCDTLIGPEDLASDAGLVSAVALSPAILLQLDEFGRWLRTIGDPRRNPHQFATVSTLMKLYSSAGGVFRSKGYADPTRNQIIEQPCVSLLATTAPEHFRQALTPESVGDGFLARLMVFEATELPPRTWSQAADPPESVMEHVRWWTQFMQGAWHGGFAPSPTLVPATEEAIGIFNELAARAEDRIRADGEEERAIWARAEEKASRLALVYACSRDTHNLEIDKDAATWACELSTYLTTRMLSMIRDHVAHGEFDARQKLILRRAREKGGSISKSELCRITQHINTRERQELVDNLINTGRLKEVVMGTKGRTKTVFQLMESQ